MHHRTKPVPLPQGATLLQIAPHLAYSLRHQLNLTIMVSTGELTMKRCAAAFLGLIGAALSLTVLAQQPPGSAPANVAAALAPEARIGSGPYPALMEAAPGLPTHTVYRPADLGAAGKLPVVAWGNGACANAGNSFRWFLSDIASYGYLVIAVGPIVTPPAAVSARIDGTDSVGASGPDGPGCDEVTASGHAFLPAH